MNRLLWGLFVLAVGLGSVQADNGVSAAEVMQCIHANASEAVSVGQITLTTTGRDGQSKTLAGRVYATQVQGEAGRPQLRAMLQIVAPEPLAGAAYLIRDTDDYLRDGMFVYLPAVGRVRRVTGTFADGSLMGSTFSYFDFKQFASAFGDLKPTLEGRGDSLRGRTTDVLRFTPAAGAETRYSAVRSWVDRESCLPLQVDFIENGTVIKRFTAPVDAINQQAGRWYLDELRLKDLRDGSVSVLRVEEVTMKDSISGRYFDPETFYRVR